MANLPHRDRGRAYALALSSLIILGIAGWSNTYAMPATVMAADATSSPDMKLAYSNGPTDISTFADVSAGDEAPAYPSGDSGRGRTASSARFAAATTGASFCQSLPQWQTIFGSGGHPNIRGQVPEMVLEARINGEPTSVFVHAACLADGRLAIADEDWRDMQLRPVAPAVLSDGRVFRPLLAASGARYVVDTLAQTISITVSPQAFDGARIQGRPALNQPPPLAPLGGYVNYDALATFGAHGLAQYGAALKGVVFGPWGLGHSDGFITSDNNNSPHFVRGETYFQKSDVGNMTTLILGDSTGVGGSWSRPIRFAGFSYVRDFTTRPDYVTFPMPSLNGSAALPSTVDVLVNNVQRLSTNVPAGPFDITNAPVISGSGQIQMVVRDSLGRETVIAQNYYADQQLLEKGLTAFAFEGGFERLYFGQQSFNYGRPVGAATFRWGAEKWLTLETRAEGESNRGALGFGLNAQLGRLGAVNAAGGYALSDTEHGLTYDLGFQRQGPFASFSATWSHSDKGYRPFAAQPDEIRPRDELSFGGGLQLGSAGSLTAAYLRQSQWSAPTREFVVAGWTKSVGSRVTLGLQSNVDLQSRSWQATLRLNIRLGRRASASSDVTTDGHGAYADTEISSPNANQPGFGWDVKARSDGSTMEGDASYNAPWASVSAGVAKSGGEVEGRVGVSGAIGIMGGNTFASRPITNSFALVRTGDVGDVPIMRWNLPDAVTNSKGVAMINDILPYENNKISVDPGALPMDVEVGGTEVNARAWPGAGVFVDLPIKRTRAVMIHLKLPDGSAAPLGATVTLKPDGATTFVGNRGEAWLTGVVDHNELIVSWSDHTCIAQLDVPKSTPYGTDLGEAICRLGAH